MKHPYERTRFQPAWIAGIALIALTIALPALAQQNPNDPGIVEPCLTVTSGVETRIPHTDQANGTVFNNLVGDPVVTRADRAVSLTGHPITRVESPNRDMEDALDAMVSAAKHGDGAAMRAHAQDLMDVLLGTTEGRIYDGFAMLNFNRGAFVPDHEPGEYKMKSVRDSGVTELGIDGQEHPIWEADVAMLYYDGQIDSDTFLLRFPPEAGEFDPVRIHYTIYALDREDFSPTVVLRRPAPARQRPVPVQGLRRLLGAGGPERRQRGRADPGPAAQPDAARNLYLGLAHPPAAHPVPAADLAAPQRPHRRGRAGAPGALLRGAQPRA